MRVARWHPFQRSAELQRIQPWQGGFPVILSLLSLKLGRAIQFDRVKEAFVIDAEGSRSAVPAYRDLWTFATHYLGLAKVFQGRGLIARRQRARHKRPAPVG